MTHLAQWPGPSLVNNMCSEVAMQQLAVLAPSVLKSLEQRLGTMIPSS